MLDCIRGNRWFSRSRNNSILLETKKPNENNDHIMDEGDDAFTALCERLCELLAKGDTQGACFELEKEFSGQLRRRLSALDPVHADQIIDETWSEVKGSLPQANWLLKEKKSEISAYAWLRCIAYRRFLKNVAQEQAHPGARLSEMNNVASPATGPETCALRRERHKVVREVIATWPDQFELELLLMRDVEGFEYDKIIEELNLREDPSFLGTTDLVVMLRQRVRRARKKVRQAIEKTVAGDSLFGPRSHS